MTCFTQNSNNKVIGAKTDSGQDSVLFNKLRSLPFLTENQSLQMYASTLLPSFQKQNKDLILDSNGEPQLFFRNMSDSNPLLNSTGLVFDDSFKRANEEDTQKKGIQFGFLRQGEKSKSKQEDIDYDLYEKYDEITREVISDFFTAVNEEKPKEGEYLKARQKWEVIPISTFKRQWEEFIKWGYVKPNYIQTIEKIADVFTENVLKLRVNTELAGHTPDNPMEIVNERYYYGEPPSKKQQKQDERHIEEYFGDYISIEENGQMRISDYGLPKLEKLVADLRKVVTPESKLAIIDKMLNVIHMRSDIADMFVEGGSKSLSVLSEVEEISNMSSQEAVFSEQIENMGKNEVISLTYPDKTRKYAIQNSNFFVPLDTWNKNVEPTSYDGFIGHLSQLGINLTKTEVKQEESIKPTEEQRIAGKSQFSIAEKQASKTKPYVRETIYFIADRLKGTDLAKNINFVTSEEMEDLAGIKALGFVAGKTIYFNDDKITLDTPIHEYGHLWNTWAKNNRPELYNKGIDLIKSGGQKYIDFVKKNQPKLQGENLYEEALAQAIGDNGAKFVKEQNKDFVSWLSDLWKAIQETLGISSYNPTQLKDITLDEFSKAVAIDLLKGEPIFTGENAEKNFEKWKGKNKEVSGAEIQDVKTGQPIVAKVYHGTTHEFYEFDSSVKGNIEGHLGRINYFTSDKGDASQNYQSTGVDITGRIEQRKERIEQDIENHFPDSDNSVIAKAYKLKPSEIKGQSRNDLARLIAEKELKGENDRVLELYVKLNNPLVLGNKSTWFNTLEVDESYLDEATKEVAKENDITEKKAKEEYDYEIRDKAIELSGAENKIVEALNSALRKNGYDTDKTAEILGDNYYEQEIDLNKLEQDLRKVEIYENNEGNLASSQVIADMFEELGFDGIILTDVSQRFKNMGIGGNTSHIHVFDQYANQIKLADGSNVTFGDTNDIRYMILGEQNLLNQTQNYEKNTVPNQSIKASTRITEPNQLLINYFGGYPRTVETIGNGDRNAEQIRKESANLKQFAIDNNIFNTDIVAQLGFEYQPQYKTNAESLIYFDPQNKDRIIKEWRSISPYTPPYNGYQAILGRILLHNYLFPETAYDIVTLTERDGIVNFVLSQPYVYGADVRIATREEIDNYMEKSGFEKDDIPSDAPVWENKDGIQIFDLYGGNVLKKNDSLFFIDPLITYERDDLSFNDFVNTIESKQGIVVGENLAGNKKPTLEETFNIIEDEESRQGREFYGNEDALFETKEQAKKYAQEVYDYFVYLAENKYIPIYRAVQASEVDLSPYGIGESWSFNLNAAKEFARQNLIGKTKIISGYVPSENINWEDSIRAYVNFSDLGMGESEFEVVIPSNNVITEVTISDLKEAKQLLRVKDKFEDTSTPSEDNIIRTESLDFIIEQMINNGDIKRSCLL